MDMQEYISYIIQELPYKKHILITGARGCGKSTLFNELISCLVGETVPGIKTWAQPGKAVYMCKAGSRDMVRVGIYTAKTPMGGNEMSVIKEGFDIYGVEILNQLIAGDSRWISIDELGYLESDCKKYIQKLNEAFNKKRVIAVARKQELGYISDIMDREDVLTIDMDSGS